MSSESYNVMLDELGFIAGNSQCVVEGSKSFAHLNGHVGNLLECCPDGATHARILLGEAGELQIHRKNLLLGPGHTQAAQPPAQAADAGGNMTTAPCVVQPMSPPDLQGNLYVRAEDQNNDDGSTGLFAWLFGCGLCAKPMPARVTIQPPSQAPLLNQLPATLPSAGAFEAPQQLAPQALQQPLPYVPEGAPPPAQLQQPLTQQTPVSVAPTAEAATAAPTAQPLAGDASKPKFCSSCGNKFGDEAMFCSGCGQRR